MSAMIWQGCVWSVRPLITGTVACSASSSSSLVRRGADHDGIDIARQHPGGIGDGLAAAELHVGAGQEQRLAAELAHADVEGDAGARRGLARRSSPASCPVERLRRHRALALGAPRRAAFMVGAGIEDLPAASAHRNRERSRKCSRARCCHLAEWRRLRRLGSGRGSARSRRSTASLDLVLGDDQRRQQAHDIVAGRRWSADAGPQAPPAPAR